MRPGLTPAVHFAGKKQVGKNADANKQKPAGEYILVTGGAGYIGSQIALDLLERNPQNQVLIVDDLSKGDRKTVKTLEDLFPGRVKFKQMKVGDKRIATILKRFKVKSVIHMAAKTSVPESQAKPFDYFQNNFVETLNLLEAMTKTGVKKLIFSSTAAVYGNPDAKDIPLKETAPTQPVNAYGQSKLMVEDVLKRLHELKLVDYIAFRYFNVAGTDPQNRIGPDLSTDPHLIPVVVNAAAGKKPPIQVNGNDFATRDGTGVRDYIHVKDLSDAHLRGLDYLESHDGVGESLNLGSKQGFSVKEVIQDAEKVIGKAVPAQDAPRRPGDPDTLIADSEKAQKLLGWKPQHDLAEMIESMWHWLNKPGN